MGAINNGKQAHAGPPEVEKYPSNIDAEKAVLGSMLMDATVIPDMLRTVKRDDFYLNAHKILFFRMQALFAAKGSLYVDALMEALKRAGEVDAVGGYFYVAGLVEWVLYSGAAAQNADIVVECARQRQLMAVADNIRNQAKQGAIPSGEIISHMSEMVSALRKSSATGGWKEASLEEIRQVRPTRRFLVEGLIPEESLFIASAKGGQLKSMIFMDMLTCVGSGRDFLAPDPMVEPKEGSRTMRVDACPVMWYNVDNPARETLDRFAALDRAHGLTELEWPIHVVNFPEAALDMTQEDSVLRLIDEITIRGVRLMMIDCLAGILGAADESNPAEMNKIMTNLRRVVEEAKCTIGLIHHHKKNDDVMRGASSFRDRVDFNLTVHREPNVDRVEVRPDKCRFAQIQPFSAALWYKHRTGTQDLYMARFFPQPVKELADGSDVERVLNYVRSEGAPKSANRISKDLGLGWSKVDSALKVLMRKSIVIRSVLNEGRVRGSFYTVSDAERLSDAPP